MTADPVGPRWPWQRSLSGRIVLSYGALFALVLLALMGWVARAVYVAQRDEVVHNLERQAVLAADSLEDPLSGFGVEFEHDAPSSRDREEREAPGHDGDRRGQQDERRGPEPSDSGANVSRLRRLATVYASNTGARVTILDPSGFALADSLRAVAPAERQFEPDARSPRRSATSMRDDAKSGALSLYATAPVISDDRLLGYVQLAVPLSSITGRIWTLVFTLAGFGLVALALSAVLGTLLGRRLVRPLHRLEKASLSMAGGDLSQRVVVRSEDELGTMGRAFNLMAERVERVVEQQRQFVANASHELRTPLTNIRLRSEALLGGTDDPVVRERFLREIEQESDRLGRLAHTLLDLARLDAAEAPGRMTSCEPNPVLVGVSELMATRAAHAEVRLESAVPPGLPPVAIDSDALETVLVNLLDNALKFTAEGGVVRLSAQAEPGELRITVEDTGRGIPADDLPHVFERFYRVDRARTRARDVNATGSGVGLGLAMVKQLVERHSGRVTLESTGGRGTTAVVVLPLAPQQVSTV